MKNVKRIVSNSMLCQICLLIVGLTIGTNACAALKSNDLTQRLQDRYEQRCDVREQFDLFQSGQVVAELLDYTHRIRPISGNHDGSSVHFSKVYYHGIPVAKMDYILLPHSKRQQSMYLDTTSATAKQQLSNIHFHQRDGLSAYKEGRFFVVQCTW